jgi:hypothetical protein
VVPAKELDMPSEYLSEHLDDFCDQKKEASQGLDECCGDAEELHSEIQELEEELALGQGCSRSHADLIASSFLRLSKAFREVQHKNWSCFEPYGEPFEDPSGRLSDCAHEAAEWAVRSFLWSIQHALQVSDRRLKKWSQRSKPPALLVGKVQQRTEQLIMAIQNEDPDEDLPVVVQYLRPPMIKERAKFAQWMQYLKVIAEAGPPLLPEAELSIATAGVEPAILMNLSPQVRAIYDYMHNRAVAGEYEFK